jgi:hypothetical protein
MNRRITTLLIAALALRLTSPVLADSAPAAQATGHPYDPCEMVSQQDIASAAGVAANQVLTPKSPTTNECVWAVGNKTGVPGQQFALTVQTVGQLQQAHGMARIGVLLQAVQSIPGVPVPNNPVVTRAFADAQVVVGLGDKAGWKSGTLSVLKNETLFQVNAVGQTTDADSLKAATSIAKVALNNLPVQ